MATFKPTSKAGKTTGAKKSTFTPTKYAGYNQSTLYGWQRQNQSALDLINQYNTRVNNGEWLSVEDRAKYKSAVDTYTSSGTALRNASKHYGTTYTDEEEKSWLDSLSSLNEGYTGVDKFYNQFESDKVYGVWKADADKRTEFEGLKNNNDYDYYVNIGKNSQANNIWNDIKKVADANHYSIGEFISDIKDGDWEALGGRALEQIISKFFPNSTIVNPVEVGSAFLDIRDFAKKWTTDKATMEEYLTPQEMDNYYYLIGKGDYEKANDYATYYSNIARKEKGEAQVPNINNNIKELATAFKSGLDSFSTGFDQTLSVLGSVLYDKDVNVYNPTTSQYAYGKAREDNTGLWMMATDAAQSIGNQVPNYALAFATGGASEFIPMAISAGGNSYAEMINEGYGEGSAIAKGVVTGALEALLGKWLGGLPGLGSSGGVFKGLQQKFLPQMSNTVARFLINNGVNMADEALEEGLQELLDPVVKWAVTLGEAELEKVNWEEVGYSALLGGLTAGVLEGVPSAIGTANTSIKTQQAFGNQAPSIVAETLAVDPTNKIALNAQNKLANNKTVSGGNLNEMLTTTDRARVKDAITNQLTEYGETSDISALAEALTKQTMGEELSKKESKLIESSKYGNRITNELNPNNIKSGQYTSKWAESIGTRRLNADVYSRRPSTKVKTKDGTNNTITNVRNVADGVATVELADSKVAKVGLDKGTTSDLVFNDPKAEGLFRIATDRVGKVEGWTTETANAMIKAYEGSTLDASAFARGWSEAYNIGKSNNSQAQLNNSSWAMLLDNKTRADAYNIGKAMSTPRVMAPTTNTYKVSFDSTVDEKSLTKEQKTQVKALDVISKALGVNVVVFDSPMGADGKRVGKNGSYNPNTRTVEIDLHAGADGKGVMLFTASHELTHHMKEVAKDKFNAYADAVFEALGENGRDLIESKLSALRANGHLDGKTDEEAYDLAFEEVVADSAEKMLVDTDALVKLSESLKSKDKTLWEKVKDYIVELANKIKKIYASLEPDSQEARMVSEMEDEIENIRKLWVEGIVASAEVSDKVAAELGVEIDTASESVSPTLMSERTWTESEYVVNRNAMAKKIALALNISERKAKKYIDDVNSIARMIANDRVRLDYQASSFGSAFVSNVEYGGSFDYTTLCKKRRLYTGTFSEIQKRLHDVALTPDEILTVRNMLIEAHKEATCGLCYVEGSRANMGKFAQKFIELYKRDNPDGWTPNMVDVNTPDGVEQMRINHPEAYEQYEYFWNHYGKLKDSDPALFASQQKPKLYEARKEYKGEILTHFKGETTIEKKNLNGGIRMQSFSDFEIIHLIDTMQVIMDMSTVGLAGQAYTKVPEFALAFGNTGLKINLSLIAKGVDENGKLIFDDREGMPHETAFDIRNKYSKNVGTIIVTFTDDQLMAAMADDRIDYIIPFHRSQWKKGQYGAMGLPKGTKDYTFMQNEKLIKQTYHEYQGRMVKDKATNYMPNEYWDFSKSGKENAEAYLKMCAENNKRPKFYKLLDYDGNGTYSLKKDGSTDGYWKLLIDFKMYDNNGKGSPQTPVIPQFNMDEATKMLDEYKGGHSSYPVAHGVVEQFISEYNKKNKTKYSDREQVEVYHGSKADFEEFDFSHLKDELGVFFAENENDASQYGDAKAYTLSPKKTLVVHQGEEYRRLMMTGETDAEKRERLIKEGYDTIKLVYNKPGGGETVDWVALTPDVINKTKYSDRDSSYLDAVNRGDMTTAQRMVDEAAKNSGYNSPKLFHGTKMFGFTEVKTSGVEKGIAWSPFFAANKEDISASYVPYGKVRDISSSMDDDAIEEARENAIEERRENISDLVYDFRRLIDRYFSPWVFGQTDNSYLESLVEKANPEAGNGDGVYDVLSEIVYDTFYEYQDEFGEYEDVDDWSENSPEAQEIFSKIVDIEGEKAALHRLEWGEELGGIYQLYANLDNMYVVDGKGAAWNELRPEGLPKLERHGIKDVTYRTRDVAEWARDNGFDGVIFKNIKDNGAYGRTPAGDVYAFFRPESQVKSADPVTYDDEGNVIPLSQRFKAENDDIRYQDRLSPEEAFSNRSLLANALLDTVQSDIEYKKLDDYKAVIGYLEAEEVKLADLKHKIYEATFGGGDKTNLKELREEARKTEARIDLHDKKLLQLESTTALKNVLERAKKQAYSKALEKGREAMHRNVEGRYKTIERNKIVKVAKELANLLEKGNKKRNIKNGAQDIVRAALDLGNMYFESDDNIIMNGIVAEATDAENLALAKYRSLYEQLHATDDDVTNHKEERKALREQMNEAKKELLSLLERERNRISKSKARDSMLALATAYGELKNSDEDYLRLAYKQEVQERLTSLAGELGDTLIADMSLKQLEALYDAFSMVKHLVTDSNKLFRDGKKEDLAKRVSGVFEDLSTLTNRLNGDYPEWFGKALNRINEFGWNNLRPVDVFELIGSSNLEDLYWDAIKAQDVYARDVEEYKAALIKARRENNYKSWDLSKTQTFKTADGELKLTLAEMMSIYAYSHREQADEHLRVGGIQFAKEATYKNDKGAMTMRGKEAHTYRVGDGVRLDIINALTKEQRAYVDTMQALLTAWGEKGNEVSRVLYGIDLFKDENYFPLRSSKDFLSSVDTEMGKTITTASLSGSGFTKSVVPHANNPIILEAFDDVVNNHIDKMSKYHAYVIPIENLRKILDAQTKDSSDLTRSVKQIISSRLGDGAKGYLEQYITDLNGGIKTGYNNGLMGLFGKAKGAQVAANLSVWVQQYFSVIRAMAEVNAKYFIPFMGESYRNPDMKLYDEMKKYAPITTIKEMGGFDVGSNRGVAEYVGYEEAKVTRGKIGKKMQDAFGVGAALMDKLGWITIWKAVKKEVASTNQYKVGSEEFYKACGERFERVIAKTQVYDSVNARSGNMRNKSDWWKMATSFMGEPTAILGMAEVAIVNYNRAKTPAEKKAAGARLATTISTITISTALTSIAKSLVYAMRDDDEDEDYLEKYASALAGAFKDDLNILNYIPIARDIVSILEGFTVERPDMALIEDLINAFKKVVDTDEDETTEQKVDEAINLAGSLANLSGVPLKNIIRDIAGLYNLVESLGKGYKTDFGGEFKENWFLGKERTKSENIYNAVIRGDTKRSEYYKSTYKDEDAYNSALRKAIRDNDPRLEEAALARLNGDRDTYYRLMMDVIDEGNFDKQIIKDAFDAEYNYQKKKAEENK